MNFSKQIVILVLAVFVNDSLAAKEEIMIEGSLSCKIIDSVYMSVEEGKAIKFSGVEGRLSKDDEFSFTYEYRKDIYEDGFIYESLRFSEETTDSDYFAFPFGDTVTLDTKSKRFFKSQDLVIVDGDKDHEIHISANKIAIEGSFGSFGLVRYFKNDWNGVLSTSDYSAGGLYAVNCLGKDYVMDKIFENMVIGAKE